MQLKYLILIPLLFNACFLAPFTEPDSQARGEVTSDCPSISCSKRSRYYPSPSREQQSAADSKVIKLTKLLSSKSDAVRTNASTDLGMLGPRASSAVPTLERLAKNDQSKWVRRSAVKSLHKIGSPTSLSVLKTVSKNDSNMFVRESASNALAKMQSETRAQLK